MVYSNQKINETFENKSSLSSHPMCLKLEFNILEVLCYSLQNTFFG